MSVRVLTGAEAKFLFFFIFYDSWFFITIYHCLQVARVCTNCGVNMGEYFCEICKFYDDDVNIMIFVSFFLLAMCLLGSNKVRTGASMFVHCLKACFSFMISILLCRLRRGSSIVTIAGFVG